MKDRFSAVSDLYSKFRPAYPREIFEYLLTLVPARSAVWDCATGNGQAAVALSEYFDHVYATDMSKEQLRNAVPRSNITYQIERAEHTSFRPGQFDLVTVAQAVHWFDMEAFNKEVERVLKPDGVIALIGYSVCKVSPGVDEVIDHYYRSVVGPYWDAERRHVDEEYRALPFPFKSIRTPRFSARYEWDVEMMLGFLETWSAAQRFKEKTGKNSLEAIEKDLRREWGRETRHVVFPIFTKIGMKKGGES